MGYTRKPKPYQPHNMVMDAAYKTPSIMRKLLLAGIAPITPYTCPKTGKGFFKKYDYAYDEYYDCCAV